MLTRLFTTTLYRCRIGHSSGELCQLSLTGDYTHNPLSLILQPMRHHVLGLEQNSSSVAVTHFRISISDSPRVRATET